MAKEPVAGRVKTRLCPPCSPEEAAVIAAAALADTLDAVAASSAERCVLALDGAPGEWLPEGFLVIPQVQGPFDRRLEAAWEQVGGPGLQIGMDTPQVTPAVLDDALGRLAAGSPCLLGLAPDGGWWAIGLQAPVAGLFAGVPMSEDGTGRAQEQRCRDLGLHVDRLPMMRDVDHVDDALAVAAAAPGTRFAATVRAILGDH